MNLKLLPVLIVLFLPACVTPTVRDDSPASDLDALRANVAKTASPTLLPNGKEYCAELARTEDEQDDCTGDLEDALFTANRKGERTLLTVDAFIEREKLRRNPCSRWEKLTRRARCKR
ncbi:MAG TPA: hypothetical protein VF680_17490 [Allosphingosinicella sp.]|jgi:hypothetical protein